MKPYALKLLYLVACANPASFSQYGTSFDKIIPDAALAIKAQC